MNLTEKVRGLGRGLLRVNLLSHRRENLRESNGLPDKFFMTKRATWRYQSRDQIVLNVLVPL